MRVTNGWSVRLSGQWLGLLVLGAASLTSCLELEETIVIRADGSGTQKVRFAMTERSLAAARMFAQASNAEAADPAQLFDARLVRSELTGAGLACRTVKTGEKRRKRVIEVEAAFAGLDVLRKSPLCGPGAEWQFLRGVKTGTVRALFFPRGEKAWREGMKRAAEMGVGIEMTERERSYFASAKARMRGLHLCWVIELPGEVLATSLNLTKTGTRRVTVTVDEAKITTARDLVRQLAPRYEVVFDGRGCTLPLEK